MSGRVLFSRAPQNGATNEPGGGTSRRRRVSLWLAALMTMGGVLVAPVLKGVTSAAGIVNNPPVGTHSILVFPQRDFVSASGYAADDLVVVKLIHPNGTTISTDPANPIVPQDDPRAVPGAPFAGIVEVNHPGGSCWFTTTPDIRPGDVVEIDIVGGPNAGTADATTVSNITVRRPVQTAPGTVVIHGTAVANDGVSQIPAAQIEQRLVANRDAFDVNGRRTLRAVAAPATADGVLSYDGPGLTTWTATYSGLDVADVTRALGAEARGMWLGAAIAPALEGTIFEIGAAVVPGPAAPCTAPLEILPPPPGSELTPPTDPTLLTAQVSNSNTVTLNWQASTDNVGVTSYGVYRDGVAVTNVQNPDGTAPAPTTYVDKNTAPGTYTYTVDAADAVGNRSGQSNAVTVITVALLAPNVAASEPPVSPVQIIGFPSRDFISSSGFDESDTVDVLVIRNGVIVSTADHQIPQADPRAAPGDAFAGTVEVNHPGGGCWEGTTSELRAGDIIRTVAYGPDGVVRAIDQTTVANVTAFRAVMVQDDNAQTVEPDGIVEVHGAAMRPDGQPIPLDQLDQRLVANRDLFDFNGRRTLRGGPGSDGVTTYDTVNNPTGVNWTTVYSGLTADDVARAVGGVSSSTGTRFDGAESRMLWLGSQPLALTELTIFENSDVTIPGPAAAVCFAPLEAADTAAPSTPSHLAATQQGADNVALSWGASTDDWYVYGYRVLRDGQAVANVGASVTSYVDVHVAPGSHTYTVAAFDSASPRGAGATIADQIMAGFGQPYGNLSQQSNLVAHTQADVTAPTVPTNLVAIAGAGKADLIWSSSSDDVAVSAYGVYRDGVKIDEVSATGLLAYNDARLVEGSYVYSIDAVDAAGNRSVQSAGATANVTPEPDVTPPNVPTGLTAATSPDVHGRNVALAWQIATDPLNPSGLAGSGVTSYSIYRDDNLIAQVPAPAAPATTVSFTDTLFAAGTYAYVVDAVDSAGNHSAKSTPAATAVVANDPPLAPHSLIAFPARDFISGTGYTPGATYFFTLLRGGQTYLSGSLAADATGLIEVNHPGGTCWNVNTPDMRPGDVIRITNAAGVADQTTVANVTAERPIAINANTVVIHGTAVAADGVSQIPLDQLDQRLVANRDLFDFNGRRTLRAGAGGDGTMSYDTPTSTKWTATYTGLSATDVVRSVGGTTTNGTVYVGAESRAMWLGRQPLALTESTIFENGAGVVGGPSAPCTAPAETPVAAATFTPASVSFAATTFLPTRQTSAATTVTFSNGGGAPMRLTNIYLAGLNRGDFVRAGGTCPTAFPAILNAGASCTVTVTFSPTALGLRQANLSFTDNAANTTDQSVPLTGIGIDNTDPSISVAPTSWNFGTVNGGASLSKVFTVTNTSADPTGRSLTISATAASGTAAADFTVTAQTCVGVALAPANAPAAAGSCTVTVQFKPGARTARAATLTLTHNAAGPTRATSPAIALSGTGGNGSVLSFASNPVTFGTVTRNTTKDQTISVKNSGNAAATLTLASFTVTGAGFTVRSTTCATLAVNGSCSVVVRFTAPNTAGAFNGTVSVSATNGLPTTVTANLTATSK